MRLTTKGRFAVTAILDLAMSQKGGPVSLADISERQGISLSYLEQLFGKLRRNELVSSVRGPGGGYLLAKNLRGRLGRGHHPRGRRADRRDPCGGKENCHDDQKCITHDLWAGLNEHIFEYPELGHARDAGREAEGAARRGGRRDGPDPRHARQASRAGGAGDGGGVTRRLAVAITLSESAAKQIQTSVAKFGGIGLRLGVKKVGCSGLAYTFDMAKEVGAGEHLVRRHTTRSSWSTDEAMKVVDGSDARLRPRRLQADVHGEEPEREERPAAAARASASERTRAHR